MKSEQAVLPNPCLEEEEDNFFNVVPYSVVQFLCVYLESNRLKPVYSERSAQNY
jgi:hypothetical protein